MRRPQDDLTSGDIYSVRRRARSAGKCRQRLGAMSAVVGACGRLAGCVVGLPEQALDPSSSQSPVVCARSVVAGSQIPTRQVVRSRHRSSTLPERAPVGWWAAPRWSFRAFSRAGFWWSWTSSMAQHRADISRRRRRSPSSVIPDLVERKGGRAHPFLVGWFPQPAAQFEANLAGLGSVGVKFDRSSPHLQSRCTPRACCSLPVRWWRVSATVGASRLGWPLILAASE
jgi:hypothetical protein